MSNLILAWQNSMIEADEVGPSLELLFADGGAFPEEITFTRASEGSYVDSAGVMSWFAGDEPRTGDRGLLIEDGRTNLLTYSQEFEDSSWGKANVSIVANAATAPDGTQTADALVENTSTSEHYCQKSLIPTLGTVYTFSMFVKRSSGGRTAYLRVAGGSSALLVVDPDTGDLLTESGSDRLASGFEAVVDGWFRLWLAFEAASADSTFFRLHLRDEANGGASYPGDGASGLYVWGAQLEAGAFPTSYIRTTSAAATRAADVATIEGIDEASWLAEGKGTLLIDTELAGFAGTGNRYLWQIDRDSLTDRLLVQRDADAPTPGELRAFVITGGVNQAIPLAGGGAAGGVHRVALAWRTNDFRICLNGAAVVSDDTGETPTGLTTVRIGGRIGGADALNDHIRSLTYYPRALGDAQLRALTR